MHIEETPERILSLPSGLTTIESEAFANLTNADAIRIPDSVTFIAEDAFSGSGIVILTPMGSYEEEWAQDSAHEFPYINE